MAASQNIARLGIVLGLDSGELVSKIEEAQKKFGSFKAQIKRDAEDAAKEIVRLEYATKNYGKTLTEVEKLNQQIELGKYKNQPDVIISNLKRTAAAYDAVALSAKNAAQAEMAGAGKGLTNFQRQAIMYQTTDTVTSLMGGQNPLMVLMQQGGQLKDQFGGLKPMFAALATYITPVAVAVTAVGASVLGLGIAFYQGSKEAEKFNAALALTNNYAGMTLSSFNSLAESIGGKYHQSIGGTRDSIQMLVASGQFAEKSISSVAQVIASFSRISGESASTVAEKLIPAFDGTASSAAKLNSQYHFLTLEQYKQIENLDKQGKHQEAITYTADAFNAKLKEQQNILGPLASLWKDVATSVADYYDKIKQFVSNGPSAAMQLDISLQHIAAMKAAYGEGSQQAVKATQEYIDLLNKFTDAAEKATNQSNEDQANEKKIEFQRKYGQQVIDMAAKTEEEKERTRYAIAAAGVDKIAQLELKKAMELKIAKMELDRKIAANPQIAGVLRDNAKAEAERKSADLALEQANLSRDEILRYREKAMLEENALEKEREKLQVYKQNVFSSSTDLEIAMSRLKTEQEIAEIERNKKLDADVNGKKAEQERLRGLQKTREEIAKQAETLKMLQEVNQAVYSNMTTALQNFVKTGKLSFKDFATGIINELINIQIRAMALKMTSGLGSIFAGMPSLKGQFESDINTSGFTMASAVGGPLNAGQASIVGENGPELFVPRGAGTIVPNSGDLSGLNTGTTIQYNGPYIASMSAIDTQSATQFLAKNKMAVWSANQSAGRSVPSSR
jgi:phage-related minor tail protein